MCAIHAALKLNSSLSISSTDAAQKALLARVGPFSDGKAESVNANIVFLLIDTRNIDAVSLNTQR